MKKLWLCIVIGMLFFSGMNSIVTSTEDSVEIENSSLLFSQPVIHMKSDYASIMMPEATDYVLEPGTPILPKTVQRFFYPIGTKIVDVSCTMGTIQQQHISSLIEPCPLTLAVSIGSDETWEKASYDVCESYPKSWYSYDIGSGLVDGKRCIIVTVQVIPVMYYPYDQMIEYMKDVSIEISYQYDKQVSSFDEQYEFLILSADDYAGNLQDLVDHKIDRGISTKVVTLSDIADEIYFSVQGRDDIEQIKYFIKDAIEAWGVSSVMIVGGADDFPARQTHVAVGDDKEVFVSDLYYADIYDGFNEFSSWDSNNNDVFAEYEWEGETDDIDFYPDVKIGRLACVSSDQLVTVIDKIISYETQKAFTKEWFNRIVVIGGDTVPESYGDESGTDEGERVNQFILDRMQGFIPDKIWDSNKRLSGLVTTGLDNIKAGIERGCGFLDFSGHGAPWVWTTFPHNGDRQSLPTPTGRYSNTLIDELTNADMLPIVFNGGCSLGKYQENENCNAWAFLANPNGGGIASFGATGLGYIYVGEYVTEGLVEGLTIDLVDAYKNGATTFGEMYVDGVNQYLTTDIGGGDYKTLMEWHAFGDPTLTIREESTPPVKPSQPDGASSGKSNQEYEYVSSSSDDDGDTLYYLFDWGDETYTWVGPYASGETATATKQWTKSGSFQVRVLAKDIHGTLSSWSEPLSVSMPKQYRHPFMRVVEWLMQWFPSLEPFMYSFF